MCWKVKLLHFLKAIVQPFEVKLAVVDLPTPYFSRHAQVRLVPGLNAEALLGMDVIQRKTNINAVTQAPYSYTMRYRNDRIPYLPCRLQTIAAKGLRESPSTGSSR